MYYIIYIYLQDSKFFETFSDKPAVICPPLPSPRY